MGEMLAFLGLISIVMAVTEDRSLGLTGAAIRSADQGNRAWSALRARPVAYSFR